MKRILKALAIIIIPIAVFALFYILVKMKKGEAITFSGLKNDLSSIIKQEAPKQEPAQQQATTTNSGTQGKTIVEQSNNQGKLLITAATTGGVGAIVGAGAVTAGKAGLTAALKTAGKVASKIALPLTAAMAIWDTKTLLDEREAQGGSLSLGQIAGQYTGLGGLGITEKLPQGIQGFLGMKI